MITFVFPGQGSQQKGMGEDLFKEFKELTSKADEILGYSIRELCVEDPDSKLNQTKYTQPAIYIVNALSYLKKVKDTGKKPDYVAGHSLGEYNALFAAGAFDFETGLKLVKKRGELMNLATGGGMAAVIGLKEDKITELLNNNNLQNIDIANYNSPSQIVISGLKADIERAQAIFEEDRDLQMYVLLKTSGAFHSHYMEDAKKEFETFIADYEFSTLTTPVISNVMARPYKEADVKLNLVKQITSPVKWTESIRYLMGLGEMEFEEIGTGRVLTGLIQRIKREATPLVIEAAEIEDDKPVLKDELLEINKEETVSEEIGVSSLGSSEFKKDYNLKYPYLAGGMHRGIASKEMVVKMGKAGMMGFLGTSNMDSSKVIESIRYIQRELQEGQPYGVNLLHNPTDLHAEEKNMDIFLQHGVKVVEASGYLGVTADLARYHAKGLKLDNMGKIISSNRIIAKISRPEIAEVFLSPVQDDILNKLLDENKITKEEADLSRRVSVADDICAEGDSASGSNGGSPYALLPSICRLRDESMEKYQYDKKVRVGAAGGIGTPEALAAAFILGADFVLTGSINQCTVEAATSDAAKDLLQNMNVQDTQYAPMENMFEMGSRTQVLKRGVFFPARANKLYDLYRLYNSIDEIDENTKKQIQEKYFNSSFENVYEEIKAQCPSYSIMKAEENPKHKMALIFKWYLNYSSKLALSGNKENKVNYQINCGPALGAFNQWVKGTDLENWRNRHVDEIGEKLINETAQILNSYYKNLTIK